MPENTQLSNLESQKTFPLKRYYVCYLDILGVRDRLFKDIECLGFDSKEISPLREQKQKAIDDVSSQINGLFDALAGLFQNFKERADVVYDESAELLTRMKYNHSELLPPKEEFIRQARKIEFGIQQFSDSTLLYIPIDEGLENIVDEVVASWMGELSRWILVGMSRGFMFRGAIAMGWGWEIRKNCLTGPVVYEAYKLESEISKYPRVIFSRSVVGRFNYRRAYAESLGVDMSKIPTFLRLLRCDVDGVYMLDYLSELAREILVTGEIMNKELARLVYDTIFAAVGKMYLDFKERGDAKLAERYWRLISYMYDKKEVWVEEPKDK